MQRSMGRRGITGGVTRGASRVAWLAALLLVRCEWQPSGLRTERFACTTSEDCAEGFGCVDVGAGLECHPDGTMPFDAGAPDAGPIDGGLRLTLLDPTPRVAGTCLPFSVAVDPALERPDRGSLVVRLRVDPPGAGVLSGSPGCTDVTTGVVLGPARLDGGFFLRAVSGGTHAVVAEAGATRAEVSASVLPVVRRGTCFLPAAGPPLPDGGVSSRGVRTRCAFSPAIETPGRAFLLSQTVSSNIQLAGTGQASCRLDGVSAITCERTQDSESAVIAFQVVELARGLRVVRPPLTRCDAVTPLDAGLDARRTMVLRSSAMSSSFYDDDDSPVVEFDPREGVLVRPPNCALLHVQLLEWADVSVTRGLVDGGEGGLIAQLEGLPPAGPNTVVLGQATAPDLPVDVCAVMVRPTLASPTSLRFSRGVGSDGGCTGVPFPPRFFERIDFGSRASVQQVEVRFDADDRTASANVRAVDLSRTLVLTSSQSAAGQGAGETSMLGSRLFTAATASTVLSGPTSVQVTRSEGGAASAFTVYVVELVP
jgi:hypothetical protein